MKNRYGILIYDFNKIDELTINIGDYIQSLAALNQLELDYKDLIKINREEMEIDYSSKPDEKIKFIANGWFTHRQETFPINDSLVPLFISVHINDKLKLTEEVIKSFKKYEPIGCRDINSMEKLKDLGIKAYFSGCLTLSFEERKNENRKGILFIVDNLYSWHDKCQSFKEFTKWEGSDIVINQLLKSFTIEEIKNANFLNQHSDLEYDIEKQFEIAENRLEELGKYELVVTTRIHTLMPAMALGTPALFIMSNNQDKRFGGLNKYWNFIDFTTFKQNGNVEKQINFDENKRIVNNNDFRTEINKENIKKIKEFIKYEEE